MAVENVNRARTEQIEAEKALRESEIRFRELADNISQFAWTADRWGWRYWYNKRWYDYTGTTFEQMQGWGCTRGVFDKSHPIGRFRENDDRIVGFQHRLNFSTEPLPWFQRWNYFLVQCVSCCSASTSRLSTVPSW